MAPLETTDEICLCLNSSLLTAYRLSEESQEPALRELVSSLEKASITLVTLDSKHRSFRREADQAKEIFLQEIDKLREEIRLRKIAGLLFQDSSVLTSFEYQSEVLGVLERSGIHTRTLGLKKIFRAATAEQSEDFLSYCFSKRNLLVLIKLVCDEVLVCFSSNGWDPDKKWTKASSVVEERPLRVTNSSTFVDSRISLIQVQKDFIVARASGLVFQSESCENSWKKGYGPVFGNFNLAIDRKFILRWAREGSHEGYGYLGGMFGATSEEGALEVEQYEVFQLI